MNDGDQPKVADKKLTSLRANYIEAEHGAYVRHLEVALSDESVSAPLNIALTGPYGSGKSSVISEIESKFPGKVVRISLSTVSPQSDSIAASDEVQKEIVKQLLYREKPSKLGSLRFKRIEPFDIRRASLFATVGAAALLAFAFASGASSRFEDVAAGNASVLWIAWPTAFVLLAVVGVLIQGSLHNRFHISALTAGPATISASSQQGSVIESVFDKYLDEIVYFFSASSRRIVIIEDLDRFESIQIFEELRELNVILNNAEQVSKPVRFVYALRDSLFDEIGRRTRAKTEESTSGGVTDAEKDEHVDVTSARARAKFFDLVVPIVPFATKRTSLDLWLREFGPTAVSREVLSIAARHVHDMRMIKSVKNEFEVFLEIVRVNDIEGLDLRDDELFALILYKSVHLESFERIKDGSSPLDTVERLRRERISALVQEIDGESRALRASRQLAESRRADAKRYGSRLKARLEAAMAIARRGRIELTMVFADQSFKVEDFNSPEFWEMLVVTSEVTVGTGAFTSTFSVAALKELVGSAPFERDWSTNESPQSGVVEVLANFEARREQLLSYEAADLARLPESGTRFEQELADAAESPMLIDLLLGGFVDRNFSLYVSRFYGETVSARAMNFVLHVVQPGACAPDARLDGPNDVEGVLLEAGTAFLGNPSAFNVNLIDSMARDHRLEVTFERLSHMEPDASAFLETYLERGIQKFEFYKRLSRYWTGAVQYALDRAKSDPALGVTLLNACLSGVNPRLTYQPLVGFADQVNANIEELSSLGTEEETHAGAIATLFQASDGVVEDVSKLGAVLRREVLDHGLFRVNRTNLEALSEASEWSLDLLLATHPAAFRRLAQHGEEYLDLLPPGVPTVTTSQGLKDILNSPTRLGQALKSQLVVRAHVSVSVENIADVPSVDWPMLVAHGKVRDSAVNWIRYFQELGLDSCLKSRISEIVAPSNIEAASSDERADFVRIVLSSDIAPMKRARFAKSMAATVPLDVSELPPDGKLFGYLLRKNLITDDKTSFSALKSASWGDRESFIRSARGFASYAHLVQYGTNDLRSLFDGSTRAEVKLAILGNLADVSSPISFAASNAMGRWILRDSPRLAATTVTELARRGMDGSYVAQIFHRWRFSDDALIEALSATRGEWRKLSTTGRQRATVESSPSVLAMLERLRRLQLVSSWSPKARRPGLLEVSMHR